MRKTKTITIPKTGGRDAGKTFLLTEMDAFRTEKWSQRALLAIAAGGVDIPEEVLRMGAGAVMAAGFRALMTMAFQDAEPLLDEMLSCVEIVPDPKYPAVVRKLDVEDVEEVKTLLLLRSEVIELHTGFSPAAFLSKLGTAATQTPDTNGSSTSPKPSETSSPADVQP